MEKNIARLRRAKTTRSHIRTLGVPRLSVHRSGQHIYAQVQTAEGDKVIAAASTTQKSLAEGFGLTVAEAMWKRRAVVASRIGGIQDQIEHGVSGWLLDDPAQLDAFGAAVLELLGDDERARAIGDAAHERVRERYLGTHSLLDYLALFERVL
jgi:glycosyltransferase involved in cell wall biosynthesis